MRQGTFSLSLFTWSNWLPIDHPTDRHAIQPMDTPWSHFLATKNTTKGGSRRQEKSHKVWMMMMMMIAASLMWAGTAEKPGQFKMTFKNHQNDSKQLT